MEKLPKRISFKLPLFNPNLLPSLLLWLEAVGAAVKESGAGEENDGVIGVIGGSDWKLASLGGGAKAAASSSLSLPVSTHWPFFASHTICSTQNEDEKRHECQTFPITKEVDFYFLLL